jgi:hypothetical protein
MKRAISLICASETNNIGDAAGHCQTPGWRLSTDSRPEA